MLIIRISALADLDTVECMALKPPRREEMHIRKIGAAAAASKTQAGKIGVPATGEGNQAWSHKQNVCASAVY
jgi:hypothetical protein